MKIKVTTKIITKLNPCQDRFDNYLKHYKNFNGSIEDFLDLEHITHSDKLWVALRLVPRIVLEEFAIDCAMHAVATADTATADAAYAAVATADAAYAADIAADVAADVAADATADATADAAYDAYDAYVANAAAYAAYAAAERQRQIEALIWLIQDHEEDNND